MEIVAAPDSLKGSLSALDAARLIERGAARVFPDARVRLCPIADGGEGTARALVLAAGGATERVEVPGPLGAPVWAELGWLDAGAAVVELAQASGLPLVKPAERDPMAASSFGTGALIARALDRGARSVVIGIGGSATNDGGMGLLRALGARFLTADGTDAPEGGAGLAQVARVELANLHPALQSAELTVICDVTNPLLGERGATAVYGPQKGATAGQLIQLERGMANYADRLEAALGRPVRDLPGSGAAGGVGAALAGALRARLSPGIDAVLDRVGFDRMLDSADLCVTAEGRLDGQSVAFGKAVVGVARRCARRGVPVAVVAGSMGEGARGLYDIADASAITCVNAPMTVEQAMERAGELFLDAAERGLRLVRAGMAIAIRREGCR
ncbi:MAG: glycerate kinase [Clostridiales bacterium]|nr:glycerate kinase [Clostridiales bacterium]